MPAAGHADPEYSDWLDEHAPHAAPPNTSKRRRYVPTAAMDADPHGIDGEEDGDVGESGLHSTPSSLLSGYREREAVREESDAVAPRSARLRHRTAHLGDEPFCTAGENENFKVVIRVRPPLQRELEGDKPFVNVVKVPRESHPRTITITEQLDTDDGRSHVYSSQTYTFDRVYDQDSKQRDVYQHTAHAAVEAVLRGYNATMIAYGQTGTGKTYTMEGFTEEEHMGIIPRATEDIFDFIQQSSENSKFLVRASYLQIYNEVISDLLRSDRRHLPIREGKDKGVYVDRLSEWVVRSPQEIYGLMEQGGRERVTGNTRMSELSSRSHAVFRIICEMKTDSEEEGEVVHSFKIGKLNLVDLAGSEKVRQTGATGQRLEESKHINKSLSHLGNVISALTAQNGRQHVPYRDSKLTRILEDSLGGNCKTTMIATISPALESYTESLSTLKYANRAKNIKNDAVVNEDLDQRALIRRYERELRELRAELMAVNQNFASKQELVDLEERHRQSEQDRHAALAALRARSVEVMEEKAAKERLEEKINSLEHGFLQGGHAGPDGGDGIAFRDAIHKVSEEYMSRLDELDKERQVIEEDKAQVDRYKQLLLKQRDIMIALTARLNERDGSILSQQEELDAYDQQQRLMEEALDQKTEQLLRAQAGRGCSYCCGPGFSAPATGPSAADGGFVLSELRRGWWGGGEKWLRENVRLEEGQEPSEDHALSSEEKVQELYGLVISLRQELDSQPPNIRQRLLDAQEEKTSMEYLLAERVNAMVQAETAERVGALKREVEQWRGAAQLAEERLRNAEYTIELGRLSSRDGQQSGELHSRVKEYLAKETAALKAQHESRVAELRRELDANEAQRRQALKESERLQFELYSLKRRFSPSSDSPSVPEFDRLWRRVQQLEEDTRQAGKDPSSLRHPFSDVSNLPAAKNPGAQQQQQQQQQQGELPPHARDRVKNLEARIEALKWQHSQSRMEYSEKLEEKNAELRRLREEMQQQQGDGGAGASAAEVNQLKRSLATHAKDRRALKTIMESKIKTKVDNVSVLLRGCYLPTAPADQRHKLESELAQLQNLINASIQAI
eukprot:TRINITY_DN3488_c2_g1_i1.p1 TRINITY_DN3488_c2_g1~~TRINITY_DN3488_c2_g1_i1.p1  ORF type:complete len:1108 (+),score=497.38 TRINITY_DN3488_c2_g1_i1:90-3326(+)